MNEVTTDYPCHYLMSSRTSGRVKNVSTPLFRSHPFSERVHPHSESLTQTEESPRPFESVTMVPPLSRTPTFPLTTPTPVPLSTLSLPPPIPWCHRSGEVVSPVNSLGLCRQTSLFTESVISNTTPFRQEGQYRTLRPTASFRWATGILTGGQERLDLKEKTGKVRRYTCVYGSFKRHRRTLVEGVGRVGNPSQDTGR